MSQDIVTNASPTPAPARRRFKASDVADHLDMQAIGQVFLAVSIAGYSRLLDAVFTEQSGSLKALLAALDAADVQALIKTAHTLKSEAGGLGLKAVFELCREIELGGIGYTPEECVSKAAQLRQNWETSRAICMRMGLYVPSA